MPYKPLLRIFSHALHFNSPDHAMDGKEDQPGLGKGGKAYYDTFILGVILVNVMLVYA